MRAETATKIWLQIIFSNSFYYPKLTLNYKFNSNLGFFWLFLVGLVWVGSGWFGLVQLVQLVWVGLGWFRLVQVGSGWFGLVRV